MEIHPKHTFELKHTGLRTSRMFTASLVAIALALPVITAAQPAMARSKSEEAARGIVSGAWAFAGGKLCGSSCATVGGKIGGAVFDGAQWVTTTVGPKIKVPKKR